MLPHFFTLSLSLSLFISSMSFLSSPNEKWALHLVFITDTRLLFSGNEKEKKCTKSVLYCAINYVVMLCLYVISVANASTLCLIKLDVDGSEQLTKMNRNELK